MAYTSYEKLRAFYLMIGEILKNKDLISIYQPSKEVLDLTTLVRKDYAYGNEVLHKAWSELNNYSVIERMNKDQRTFQSFVDESVENPDEAWKWIGTRSLARKKAFAMHAHMTSSYVVPSVFPQNSSQDDDKAMALSMRDIVEWETINSNYRPSFLLAAMGMLVNPVTYLQADYFEVYQKIIEKQESGKYTETEILDEVLSGLNCRVWSTDQILISNVYEQDIQKQRAIIKKRYVEYSELEAKYGDHPNWSFLQPGIKAIYNDKEGLFYDVKDDDHPYLVEEATWENRRDDAEVCFLNGIYFGNENIDWNPIRHRDNRNAPKYDIVPFGYHRINEHFFYYASLMFEVGWDDKLIDAMYQVEMNRGFLDVEQPSAATGFEDKIDTSVMFPGAIISTSNPQAKVQSILPPRNRTLFEHIHEIEDSMSEASLSETQMGALPEASQKAYTVAKAEQNAKILLSGAMKSLGESISQFGALLVDIALQHLTTAQVDEITGGLKYREFVLENQMVGGKKVSKKIRFDESLMGKKFSEKSKKQYAMKLLEEAGYPDNKQALYVLNPHLFSKMNYLVRIEPDEMMPKNAEFDKIIAERLYTLLRQDPLIEPEALVRKLLYTSYPQDADELLSKQNKNQMNQMIQQIMGQNRPTLPGLPSNIMSGAPA